MLVQNCAIDFIFLLNFNTHANSSYNQQEIDILMGYLQRILKMSQPKVVQSDIGIISPYRRQCEKLTEQCAQKGYNDIQIGSVETYQGQEKPIIIVSTVRSQMNSIGFLDSKKVTNVNIVSFTNG